MSDIWLVSALKFLGLFIGLVSAAWGLTRKATIDDENGRKRLTPAGQVTLVLAIGSFLISATLQGFETLAKAAEGRDRQLQEVARKAENEARQAREFRTEQRGLQALSLQRLARSEARGEAAENRAARAEQRLLVLGLAQQGRQSDQAISREINLASVRNLNKTESALEQLDRMAQPLGDLDFSLMRSFYLKNWLNDPFLSRLRKASIDQKVDVWLDVGPGDPLMPTSTADANWYFLINSGFSLYLFADPVRAREFLRLGSSHVNSPSPDLVFFAQPEKVFLTFARCTGELAVHQDMKLNWHAAKKTGAIISQKDLDKATFIMELSWHQRYSYPKLPQSFWSYLEAGVGVPEEEFQLIRLDTGARSLSLDDFERYNPEIHKDFLVVDRVGMARSLARRTMKLPSDIAVRREGPTHGRKDLPKDKTQNQRKYRCR